MKPLLCLSLLLMLESFSCYKKIEKLISCEEILTAEWQWLQQVGEQKTCSMNETTGIPSDNYKFSFVDTSIGALRFTNNKKILYLPIRLDESFPNLVVYNAAYCSLTKITKRNFNNLRELKGIRLSGNKIEEIPSDTFTDLVSLEFITFSDNKIKFINGNTFRGSPNLKTATFYKNDCIHRSFEREDIKTMPKVISESCQPPKELYDEILTSKCGLTSSLSSSLTIGGNKTARGQWPFLVGIFSIKTDAFICGGNLISTKHVMTAAHCIQNKYQDTALTDEDVLILVGKYNLRSKFESDSSNQAVENIFVHPDWKYYSQKYDADLAILKMKVPVHFTKFVQPVCLPTGLHRDLSTGFVVGWGESENKGVESIPRQVELEIVDAEDCYPEFPELAEISSSRTFCAGGQGTGPCRGDSGGGFFVKTSSYWTLKGMVSASLIIDNKCDVNKYAVYTEVYKYINWIKETVTK